MTHNFEQLMTQLNEQLSALMKIIALIAVHTWEVMKNVAHTYVTHLNSMQTEQKVLGIVSALIIVSLALYMSQQEEEYRQTVKI